MPIPLVEVVVVGIRGRKSQWKRKAKLEYKSGSVINWEARLKLMVFFTAETIRKMNSSQYTTEKNSINMYSTGKEGYIQTIEDFSPHKKKKKIDFRGHRDLQTDLFVKWKRLKLISVNMGKWKILSQNVSEKCFHDLITML